MDLSSEKEIIRRDVGIIVERRLSSVQVYILCKAIPNELFQYSYENFMRYLDVLERIECEQEDKIDLMFHLISLDFGNFDDVIQNLIEFKGLDPISVSNILKKKFMQPTYESKRPEIPRDTPGNYAHLEINHIANSSQETFSTYEIDKERNIRMSSLGLGREVITQGGPEYVETTTSKDHQNLISSQNQPIDYEQLTDRQHPTTSPVFDKKMRSQQRRTPHCVFCNYDIENTQDQATFSTCYHHLHRRCFINTLNHFLNLGSVEIRCACNSEISETDIKNNLSESDYNKLEEFRVRKLLEEEHSDKKAEFYHICSRCGLKVGMNRSDSYCQCHCGVKYCSECLQEFNQKHKCLSKKPEPVCDHITTLNKKVGVGIIACGKCNATLCEKCHKMLTACSCRKKK